MSLSAEVNIFYNECKDVVVVSVFRLGITGNVSFVLGFSFNRPMGLDVFFYFGPRDIPYEFVILS